MKIIELLNKIANREVVPEKIKYNGEEFQFTGYDSASKNYNNELEDLFEVLDGSMLNDEVEIIEPQEHKIPEKLSFILHDDNIVEIPSNEMLMNKINKIIDYLEEIE